MSASRSEIEERAREQGISRGEAAQQLNEEAQQEEDEISRGEIEERARESGESRGDIVRDEVGAEDSGSGADSDSGGDSDGSDEGDDDFSEVGRYERAGTQDGEPRFRDTQRGDVISVEEMRERSEANQPTDADLDPFVEGAIDEAEGVDRDDVSSDAFEEARQDIAGNIDERRQELAEEWDVDPSQVVFTEEGEFELSGAGQLDVMEQQRSNVVANLIADIPEVGYETGEIDDRVPDYHQYLIESGSPVEITEEDVGITTEGEFDLSSEIETEIQERRERMALASAAGQFEDLSSEDFEVRERLGQQEVVVREEVQRDRIAEQTAEENPDLEAEDLDVMQEGGEWVIEPTEDAEERIARQQIAEDQGVDPEEVEIQRDGEEIVGVIEQEQRGGFDLITDFIDDPVGTGQDSIQAITDPVTDFIDDPIGEGQDIVTDITDPVVDFGSDVGERVQQSEVGGALAAGAPLAAAEPTPVGEGVLAGGAVVAGGAIVGSEVLERYENSGTTLTEVRADTASGEIDVGRPTQDRAELGIGAGVGDIDEIGISEDAIEMSEIDVPEGVDVSQAEIEVPDEYDESEVEITEEGNIRAPAELAIGYAEQVVDDEEEEDDEDGEGEIGEDEDSPSYVVQEGDEPLVPEELIPEETVVLGLETVEESEEEEEEDEEDEEELLPEQIISEEFDRYQLDEGNAESEEVEESEEYQVIEDMDEEFEQFDDELDIEIVDSAGGFEVVEDGDLEPGVQIDELAEAAVGEETGISSQGQEPVIPAVEEDVGATEIEQALDEDATLTQDLQEELDAQAEEIAEQTATAEATEFSSEFEMPAEQVYQPAEFEGFGYEFGFEFETERRRRPRQEFDLDGDLDELDRDLDGLGDMRIERMLPEAGVTDFEAPLEDLERELDALDDMESYDGF